jgi:exonuclease III
MQTYRVGTLNFVGSTSSKKITLLHQYLRVNSLDILFLTECNYFDFHSDIYYREITVPDNGERGISVIYRKDLQINNLMIHTSGRLISFVHNKVAFIGVYLASGNNN